MSTKLVFAIPLKSKHRSNDWEEVLRGLRRTLKSIDNQTDRRFEIWVASNDVSELEARFGQAINYSAAEFDLPDHPWNAPNADKHKKRVLIASELRKRMHSSEEAFLMFLDGDDLVHKDLVKYVLSESQKGASIVFETGYTLDLRAGTVAFANDFPRLCGSCFVGLYQFNDLPERIPGGGDFSQSDSVGKVFLEKFGDSRTAERREASCHNYIVSEFPAVVYTRGSPESISRDIKRNRKKAIYFNNYGFWQRTCLLGSALLNKIRYKFQRRDKRTYLIKEGDMGFRRNDYGFDEFE